jgi:hypothetical protein
VLTGRNPGFLIAYLAQLTLIDKASLLRAIALNSDTYILSILKGVLLGNNSLLSSLVEGALNKEVKNISCTAKLRANLREQISNRAQAES